jgi:dephospho-CoA kinase
MLIVGLTGGIASGKSLVTRVLRELGAHVIDADKIVHGLLAPGQEQAARPAPRPAPVAEPPAEKASDADDLSKFILDNLL